MSDPFLEFLRCPDRHHYTRFVTEYADAIARVARRVVGCESVVDDVVQDVFLRLAESRQSPDEIRHPRAYVLRAALNQARNHLARESVREGIEERAACARESEVPSAAESAASAEEVARINRAIDELPTESRIAVHLRAVEGLSYREIAEVVGVSVPTVTSRIRRGREKLRRTLRTTVFALPWSGLRSSRVAGAQAVSVKAFLLGLLTVAIAVSLSDNDSGEAGQDRISSTENDLQVDLNGEPMNERKNRRISRERRWRHGAALALSIGLSVEEPPGRTTAAEPGELLASFDAIPAPQDITVDERDGTFWVSSLTEPTLFHFGDDFDRRLGTVPLPFSSPTPGVSFATGLAWDALSNTLWVVDSRVGRTHEIQSDGALTGRAFDLPFSADDGATARGLAFHSNGDDGAGTFFVVESRDSLIYEVNRTGETVREFPAIDDPERSLGRDLALFDVAPIMERDSLTGFYASTFSEGPAILKLDAAGRYADVSISLAEAGDLVTGILRRAIPSSALGGMIDSKVDAYVCLVEHASRVAILSGGEPDFQSITDLACSTAGDSVQLSWIRPQEYDAIQVLDHCEVVATLPGDANGWTGSPADEELQDGVRRFSVRVSKNFDVASSGPCVVISGNGQLVKSVQPGVDRARGVALVDTLADGPRLFVSDGNAPELAVFDLELTQLSIVPVSSSFVGESEHLGGISAADEPDTVFVVNRSKGLIGKLRIDGELLEIFAPPFSPRSDIVFDPEGNDGFGSLWTVDGKSLFELSLSGSVLRQINEPGAEFIFPHPGESAILGRGDLLVGEGIALGDGPRREILVTARNWLYDRYRVLRLDIETGRVVGAGIPLDELGNGMYAIEHFRQDDRSRLFAQFLLGHDRRFVEYRVDRAELDVPPFLLCRQATQTDEAMLSFPHESDYDAIEVYRDCEIIATLQGDATSFIDTHPRAGVREYSIRGVRGEQTSHHVRCSLRVGIGAVLQREYFPFLISAANITWDAGARQFWVVDTPINEASGIYRFGEEFRLLDARESSVPLPRQLTGVAIRTEPGGRRLLYTLASDTDRHFLRAETFEGELVREIEFDAPRFREGGSFRAVGLGWDARSDTFYFVEPWSETIVQLTPSGEILRSFPHPAPPRSRFFQNVGLSVDPERGTIWATNDSGSGPAAATAVEIDFDGRLTGREIPLTHLKTLLRGISVRDGELIAIGSTRGAELIRIKAFPDDPVVGAKFVRGDSNFDSGVEISDAVFTLGALFLGGPQPDCLDAADSNDDGAVDLSDAVHVLAFLFLGGAAPPEPFPTPGHDSTADALSCLNDR